MSMETQNMKGKYELLPQGASLGQGAHIVNKKRMLIGRSQACDIVLPFNDVTAIHAILEIVDDKFKIYDMNSTNGTYVNGNSVVAESFSLGDKIKVASHEFEFKNFIVEDAPALPLDMLQEVALPPVMEEEPSISKLPKARPVQTSEDPVAIPRVEYPLAKDPKAEFSEYIFEDAGDLYPIFHYQVDKTSVEVVILFKDRIYSADYLPANDGEYKLVGVNPNSREIEFSYVGAKEKIPFITVDGGKILVEKLSGYECQVLQDKDKADNSLKIELNRDEIVRFHHGDLQIFVRNTEAPPKVDPAPVFRRDKELKKYLFLVFFLITAFMGTISFLEVDEEIEKEKIPERIATILYKKKPVLKEAQKKITLKKQNKKSLKKPAKPVVKKKISNKKPKQVQQKKKGAKNAKKTGEVKRAKPNKGPKDNLKTDVVRPKKTRGGKQRPKNVTSKASKQPSKSLGNVDTYKSVDFKSTVNSLLSKGGTSKSFRAKKSDVTGLESGTAVVGGESATLKRAKVSGNVGSLSGSTRGKLDASKGAEGLVNKKSIAVAGIPAKTVVHGGLDPDVIRRILLDHLPQFKYCYQSELDKASNGFAGMIPLNFIIGASGHVTKAAIGKTRGRIPTKVKKCTLNVLRGIKFPEPLGGGVAEVNQPLNFSHYSN